MENVDRHKYVLIISLRSAQMYVPIKFHNQRSLAELFDLQGQESSIVLLDPEGEEAEIDENKNFLLNPKFHYTIVTEEDIDEEEDKVFTADDKLSHIAKVEQIRRNVILREWKPKHVWLYTASDKHFDAKFLAMLKSYKTNKDLSLIQSANKLTPTGLYQMDSLFSQDFCDDLIDEVNAMEASGLPIVRPNTMNRYGVVLAEFGMDAIWNQMLFNYLQPLFVELYPQYGPTLDHHHAFIVEYKPSEQAGLAFHHDDAEVTVNMCLGKSFKGGDLYFQGLVNDPTTQQENFIYHNKTGRCIFHLGEHRHGAHPISEGERYNIIIWYRSSAVRAQRQSHDNHHH